MIDDADLAIKPMEWHYKRWLDRYPITVEVKGGQMVINPEIIVITSQYTPEQIWEGDNTTLDAIRRRTLLVMMTHDGPTGRQPVLPDGPVGPVGPVCVQQPYENGYRTYITYEKN